MPSPPLSPTPRRWRSPDSALPSADVQRLTSSIDPTSHPLPPSPTISDPSRASPVSSATQPTARPLQPSDSGSVGTGIGARESYLSAPETPRRDFPPGVAPEIRTTSPSPQRPVDSPIRYSEGRLSPLLPPPTRLPAFDDTAREARVPAHGTLARSLGTRGSVSGPRGMSRLRASETASSDDTSAMAPQPTGGSLSAQYDDVLAQLDALANPSAIPNPVPEGARAPTFFTPGRSVSATSNLDPSSSASDPFRATPTHPSGQGYEAIETDATRSAPPLTVPAPSSAYQPGPRATFGLGIRLSEGAPLWRPSDVLEAVSERTEPVTSSGSSRTSPVSHSPVQPAPPGLISPPRPTHQRGSTMDTGSLGSIASRFPLPPSPVKGPRDAPTSSPAGGRGKASELIKMFETRASADPSPAPDPPPIPAPLIPQPTGTAAQRFDSIFHPPPSSFRDPESAPSVPPKSTSPIANVKTMIASWRARAGSETQRVVGTPGRGADTPRLFGRGDKGWNVSIRRRRRDEGRDVGLAEQAEEPAPSVPSPPQEPFNTILAESTATMLSPEQERTPFSPDPNVERSASVRSLTSRRPTSPRALTGEPLKTGIMYYLNVHDANRAPDYEWVRTDARLFREGLQLVWRTSSGVQAMVTLDLDFCEEVASIPNPNNPAAAGDLGTIAARRQGDLADNLYPFKLVYDDGTERLGCDSSRERIRWVDAIWMVLETRRTRDSPTPQAERERPRSLLSTSDAGGSSSTYFAPLNPLSPSSEREAHSPLPHAGLSTSDDAVVLTAGGLVAPLTQRGSRRLAAGGPERARSLRRVASEADLAESAQRQDPDPEEALSYFRPQPQQRTGAMLSPLTTTEARSRPSSRDFTFAGGIPPPPLVSPPPSYTSPPPQTFATAAEILSPAGSYHLAPSTSEATVAAGPSLSQSMSQYGTAAESSPQTFFTPATITTSIPPEAYGTPAATQSAYGTAPPLSIYGTAERGSDTAPSPTKTAASDPVSLRTALRSTLPYQGALSVQVDPSVAGGQRQSFYQTPGSPSLVAATAPSVFGTVATAPSGMGTVVTAPSVFGTIVTAPEPVSSVYSTAPTVRPVSAYATAIEPSLSGHTARDSMSSYVSAPPPVPSRDSQYATAPPVPSSSGHATPVRHQLYDAPVPPYRQPSTPSTDATLFATARPPTTQMATAESGATTTLYQTASSYSQSHYSSAPPPPMSRSSRVRSVHSIDMEPDARWDAATHISEPDTDYALIADLERKSSSGSAAPPSRTRPRPDLTVYATATTGTGPYFTATEYKARSGKTVFGRADENTLYNTARGSAYTTASGGKTQETYMTTALSGSNQSYQTARTSQTPIRGPPSSQPQSVSTAQSTQGFTRIPRKPVPPVQPPPPSPPPPGPPSSSSGETSIPSTSTATSIIDHPRQNTDMLRILNYLDGQEKARQGQSTRMAGQLDRIESKIDKIHLDAPPPVPTKDDDSPPSSPSSTSSIDTARPVTPPPFVLPASLADRIDDLTKAMGTVLGQQEEIMQELHRRRSFDVDLDSSRNLTLPRIEDLLRRILLQTSAQKDDAEFATPLPRKQDMFDGGVPAKAASEREGTMYRGDESVYSDEAGFKARAPPNSRNSQGSYNALSPLSDSLLEGDIGEPDFDDEFAIANLPPVSPPHEHATPRAVPPPTITMRGHQLPQQTPAQTLQQQEYYDGEFYPDEYTPQPVDEVQPELPPTPQPVEEVQEEQDLHPVPYRPVEVDDEAAYEDEEEDWRRGGPTRRGPPPAPVDLPTPVESGSRQPFPHQQQMPMPPPSGSYPLGPPPPGFVPDIPRPSLPRIAGVRDPISTTYFRRGFPPGLMGLGMFPPMGMMGGPGMGPFMPGIRPGLAGFGGPLGPNVAPGPRRPGFFPPGVPGTTGDYGLPAAARYANPSAVPTSNRQGIVPDSGVGNTTSESTSPTPSHVHTMTPATTEHLVTPVTSHAPLTGVGVLEPVTPGVESSADDSFRRTLENAQAIAEAQGQQQNEMSQYLHGMSDQIQDVRDATQKDLADILTDISRLRGQLARPDHVHGHVLPDGTVQLTTGEIIDGIRGAEPTIAAPLTPATSHILGKVLPDGTVMAGGKVVDGIRGAPHIPTQEEREEAPQTVKDMEQDRRLASLADKVAELMHRRGGADENASTHGIGPTPKATPLMPGTDIVREKTHIKEREFLRNGPSGTHREIEKEEEIDRDLETDPAAAGAMAGTAGSGGIMSPTGRVNPRTGKPLMVPAPLSLKPTDPLPIDEEVDPAQGGQLIGEEHEEVIHRPTDGGPPLHTHTTTRTYTRPGASGPADFTLGDPANGSAGRGGGSHVPPGQFSEHAEMSEADAPAAGGSGMPPSVPVLSDRPRSVTGHTHAPGPGTAFADPSNGGGGGGKAPTSVGDKPVWSTNRAKNPHGSGGKGSTGGGGGGGMPDAPAADTGGGEPDFAEADPGDAGGGGGDEGDPSGGGGGGGDEGDLSVGGGGPPAPPSHKSGGGGKGVHWQPMIPSKPVSSLSNVPTRQKPSSVLGDPAGKPANPASNKSDPSGGGPALPPSGKSDPAGTAPEFVGGDVGDGDDGDGAGAGAGGEGGGAGDGGEDGVAGGGGFPGFPAPGGSKKTSHTSAGKLGKSPAPPLPPSKSKGSTKTAGEGPPLTGEVAPITPHDKNTRFSDVVHPSTFEGGGGGAEPFTEDDVGGGQGESNKLKKSKKGTNVEGDAPGAGGGFPGGGGSLGAPGPGGHGAATRPPSIPAGPVEDIPILEEITLPGGQKAFIKRGSVQTGRPASIAPPTAQPPVPPPPEMSAADGAPGVSGPGGPGGAGSGKGKLTKPKPGDGERDVPGPEGPSEPHGSHGPGAPGGPSGPGVPAESEVGKGHCAYCCPNDPRPGLSDPRAETDKAGAGKGPASMKSGKGGPGGPPPPMPIPLPGAEGDLGMEGPGEGAEKAPSKKLQKSKPGTAGAMGMSPEEETLEDAKRLAVKQKAAAESAAAETAEKERVQKEKEDLAKLAADRHKENADALAALKHALDGLAGDQKAWRTNYDDTAKGREKRLADKTARDKKFQDALDKLVADKDEMKKLRDAEGKKPGTQAILDALKSGGDAQSAFLRKLATEIMEQNSNQHKATQEAATKAGREQVAFNLAGYLDDFSRALSGEVRALLKEVGDLRESRRALYMELAELLLMKGRQSAGDLMAVLPYPVNPAVKPPAAKPAEEKKAQNPKQPQTVPQWANWGMIPPPVVMGGRPLPSVGGGGAVPPPPLMAGFVPPVAAPAAPRPLPQPKQS